MSEINEIEKTKSIIQYFLNHESVLKEISLEEVRDLLDMISQATNSSDDDDLWEMGALCFFKCCMLTDLTIEEMWQTYWKLSHWKFSKPGRGKSIHLDKLYRHIFFMVKENIDCTYEKIKHPHNNRIVMVTSQFLTIQHAPTRRILDYSYAIANALGKECMIINDAGMNFIRFPNLDFYGQALNFFENYNHFQSLSYKDKEFTFKQLDKRQPDLDSLRNVLQEIYEMRPGLVYNIGGSSLLTDLCSMFTKTACFPCSTNIPISMSEHLFVGRKLTENDSGRLNELESYQKVYETVVNFQLDQSTQTYSRKQFGISEETFLIAIVGTRLGVELDEEFVNSIIKPILDKTDSNFLVIGPDEEIQESIKNIDGIYFAGSLPDAFEAVKLCDLYCNTLRDGGGRSGFEALACGVPVVTLKYGDVYHVCGEEFAVDNREDYVNKVIDYVRSPALRQKAIQQAEKRALYLSDIEKTQSELLNQIL